MASVFKNAPKELPGSDLEDPPIPGDLQDSMREEREKRTVAFHPTAFVNKASVAGVHALHSFEAASARDCLIIEYPVQNCFISSRTTASNRIPGYTITCVPFKASSASFNTSE